MSRNEKPTEQRFRSKVDKNGPVPAHCPELGPCHVWTGGKDADGYGKFKLDGKDKRAHRVAFFLTHGRWPEPCCCHRCDNRPCCNPAHMFEGTNTENTADKVAKGRQASGDANGLRLHPERAAKGIRNASAKLTEQNVRDIRSEYAVGDVSQRQLAARHGVSQPSIGLIIRGGTWGHVR